MSTNVQLEIQVNARSRVLEPDSASPIATVQMVGRQSVAQHDFR
jgi:hypothetical protein